MDLYASLERAGWLSILCWLSKLDSNLGPRPCRALQIGVPLRFEVSNFPVKQKDPCAPVTQEVRLGTAPAKNTVCFHTAVNLYCTCSECNRYGTAYKMLI